MDWEAKFARVVQERGHEEFFERFLLATEVQRLVIISPWITALEGERITLGDVVAKINSEKVRTTVIMRHPNKEALNQAAARIFGEDRFVTVYSNNELHAKVYVCRCSPYGFALVSSANLSGRATRALEIGILIEGKGHGKRIIEDLELLGTEDLPNRSGTLLYARNGILVGNDSPQRR